MPVLAGVNIGGAVAGALRSVAYTIRTWVIAALTYFRQVFRLIVQRASILLNHISRLTRTVARKFMEDPAAGIAFMVFIRELVS